MSDIEYVEVKVRLPKHIAEGIDERRAQVGVTQGRPVSRNEWLVNVSSWVIEQLPHQAVRADLVKAWPGMPPEALGVDPR